MDYATAIDLLPHTNVLATIEYVNNRPGGRGGGGALLMEGGGGGGGSRGDPPAMEEGIGGGGIGGAFGIRGGGGGPVYTQSQIQTQSKSCTAVYASVVADGGSKCNNNNHKIQTWHGDTSKPVHCVHKKTLVHTGTRP